MTKFHPYLEAYSLLDNKWHVMSLKRENENIQGWSFGSFEKHT